MRRRPLCFLCVMLLLFFFLLHLFGLPLLPDPLGTARAEAITDTPYEVTVFGKVLKSESLENYSVCIISQCILCVKSEQYQIKNVRLTFKIPRHYAAGSLLRVRGILSKIKGASNPGEFDRTLYYRLQGIGYSMKEPEAAVEDPSFDFLREGLALLRNIAADRVREVYPEDVSGILAAMLTGDRSLLTSEEKYGFQMGGISHMLAISGLHLTLLGMGLYKVLRKIRLGMKPSCLISAAVLFLYTVLTGMPVSALRAFIMFVLVMGAKLAGRTYDSFTAMAAAAILLMIENPYYLFYSGFQLSFLAVLTCALFRKRSRFMLGLFLFLISMPAVLASFYEIPLYGILVNLAAVPVLPAVLGFGIAGTVFGGFLSFPAVTGIRFYNFLISFVKKLPFSTVILGKPDLPAIILYVALLIAFLYLSEKWRTDKKRFFLLAAVPVLILIFAYHPRSHLSLTFLDVGQGDGIVLESPEGMNALIDSGSSTVAEVGAQRVIPYLKSRGIRKLDYIFVTHMDSDHISGIKEILTAIRDRLTSLAVGTLVLPEIREKSESYQKMTELAKEAGVRIITVRAGDSFTEGGAMKSGGNTELVIRVIGPDPSYESLPADENAQCLVLSVSCGSFDALLTGDVCGEGETNLEKYLIKQKKEYELLKVAHHGSKYSTPKELLDLIRPQAGIISAGEGNWYGHPHAELIKRLKAAGTDIYETEKAGAVTVTTDGNWFETKKFRQDRETGTALYQAAK